MNIAICTLFEGNYHFGVAALSNSLYKNGFRGNVYIGYKGGLPYWANKSVDNKSLNWEGAKTLEPATGLYLHFLPLTTNYHLTNYKPDFMLQLWEGPAKEATGMFYLDPDIICEVKFSYLEEWINCGIALCEDVNSPLQKYHPKRVGWRNYFQKYDLQLNFKNQMYVNGGFIGLTKSNISFLKKWKYIQELMGESIGGLEKSAFINCTPLAEKDSGDFAIFGKTDQDALNATVELDDQIFSFAGKETMGFKNGLVILPHALGSLKPWKYKPFKSWLNGISPRLVDKSYWSNVQFPINLYPAFVLSKMKFKLKIVSFLARFYSK